MTDNPIIEEVRQARQALLDRFGGDMHALVKELRREQAEGGRVVVRLPPRPVERPKAKTA
jgi:hypothetical protein